MSSTILAIESSCDDTSASICRDGIVLSNVVHSQIIHKKYGGVVPELASRAHIKNVMPVVEEAFHVAKINKKEIDAVAVTQGPGLPGALMVGVAFAKGLALSLNKALIGVNHLMAHVMAVFIDKKKKPTFPFLCLLVSGGNTVIYLVKNFLDVETIGQTTDDAAGEAFDKIANMFGLEYPGGILIDKLSEEGLEKIFAFPEPNMPNYDFSFSGLKTAILYFIRDKVKENPRFVAEHLSALCSSVQYRIVTILLNKLFRCANDLEIKDIAIVGGVSANSKLRELSAHRAGESGKNMYFADLQYCTDNAGMIAYTGHLQFERGQFETQEMVSNPVLRV